jgi:hypothetical protein
MSTTPITTGGVGGITTLASASGNIQMMFAALQLQMAQTNKEKAMEYMDQMTANQAKAKECAEMLAKARELQNPAKQKGATDMPSDMVKYYNDNNISFDTTGGTGDYLHNSDEWDYNIKSLTNLQETLNTGSQQQMVFLQDFMGQYNSYLTGANSAMQQSNQTLSTIARGQ